MSSDAQAARPLFIDTGAFFAHFNEKDNDHERASAVFEAIGSGSLPYRPLYTSGYVLSELATLTRRKQGHAAAVEALDRADAPGVTVLHPGAATFADTRQTFAQYDDQQISFVDHTSGVLARQNDVERIFAFDENDFRTLGFTVVPEDTGEP